MPFPVHCRRRTAVLVAPRLASAGARLRALESSMARRLGLAAWSSAVAVLLGTGCATRTPEMPPAAALQGIDAAALLAQISTLSSPAFEGRAPGTAGERRTLDFLVAEFRRLGLVSASPDGSYLQEVPMVGIRSAPQVTLRVGERTIDWETPRDYLGGPSRLQPSARVDDAELVFVGHGVVAPEYGWDDYRGADVNGKIVVTLPDDPQVVDPARPGELDAGWFKGRVQTWYSTSRHKREMATARGAAGRIGVWVDGSPLGPWSVVQRSTPDEDLDVALDRDPQLPVSALANETRMRELFALGGHDFDALRRAAARPGFRPVPLGVRASVRVTNQLRELRSYNVAAKLVGSDPRLRDEVVVYTAHWDHLGRDTKQPEAPVFHGAVDNASGTAGLLQVAAAFAALPQRPKRSVLFLATTGEERGLLGAKYYVARPLVPLARTLAAINFDVLSPWGRTHDMELIGHGESSLGALFDEVARAHGKTVLPDSLPEQGLYYRSDHLEFARAGVPVAWTRPGRQAMDMPPDALLDKYRDYGRNRYHRPSDTVQPDWDLRGMVEHLQIAFAVGWRLAQGGPFPTWNPGTEFKAKRDAMLAAPPSK
jgi:hypothetical protein